MKKIVALLAALLVLGCTSGGQAILPVRTGEIACPPRCNPLGAGFRWSTYGPDYDPGPEYWGRVGLDMARRFEDAVPETLWIVSRLRGQGTLLNFPVTAKDPLISGSQADANEAILDHFDRLGYRVWLQIEPAYASVDELIDLVLKQYSHHPSVVGFGIDVEWYRSSDPDEGQAVTDEEARQWLQRIRTFNPSYRLFLKHFSQDKMPPTEREGILFVDDSQILPDMQSMIDEFASWGRRFAPAPVAFQYGYPSDKHWWSKLQDPPREIGQAILDAAPNTEGLYWVDFTVLEQFPPATVAPSKAPTIAQSGKFEGLAPTPPMGWNSWNRFQCDVNETLIRETADAMVSSGMRDAGYEYVVIDDCWHGERDSRGFIQADPKRFPSGMKALADYIHGKGLKFGIYSDAGSRTCGGRPGSRGHEYQDALTYASWGVDYLKYDWCNTEGLNPVGAYLTMSQALRAADRPVVLSICEWGDNQPWEWGKNIGHLWRTTGDITSCFDCIVDHGTWSSWGIMQILDMQHYLRSHAGPDHWNDPDMLEVGNGMTVSEDRAHFSMWSILAAPLIAGNDLRTMPAETRAILTNRDVIAVNQDALGIQGFKARAADGVEYWFKPLAGDDWAMVLLNRGTVSRDIVWDWAKETVQDELARRRLNAPLYGIRDLWTGRDRGDTSNPLTVTIPPHDVVMLRLTPR